MQGRPVLDLHIGETSREGGGGGGGGGCIFRHIWRKRLCVSVYFPKFCMVVMGRRTISVCINSQGKNDCYCKGACLQL